jgi:hypothetical protein
MNSTKATLVDEIARSVKNIEKENILHSVLDFTVRLRSIQKNGGDYIRQINYTTSCRILSAIF